MANNVSRAYCTYDAQAEGLVRVQEPPALAETTAYPSSDSGTYYKPSSPCNSAASCSTIQLNCFNKNN